MKERIKKRVVGISQKPRHHHADLPQSPRKRRQKQIKNELRSGTQREKVGSPKTPKSIF